MHISRVDDIGLSELAAVDLFICASGYERRSTFLFEQIDASRYRGVLVLGFETSCQSEWRAVSDQVFAARGAAISIVREDEERSIFELLERSVPAFESLRILIDYSSMPRRWINAIINYFKFREGFVQVELFFAYAMGEHVDREFVPSYPRSDYEISSIESLTTLEGAAVRQKRTLAIIGLGFEWIAPFAACELMEPDEVIAFYGEPGSVSGYGQRAIELNGRFLSEFCRDDEPIALPVRSVEHAYRVLGELAAPALATRNVALVPLGPKPHVLACVLVANRLPEATCIYVRGGREEVRQVIAVGIGNVVLTRVTLLAPSHELAEPIALD